MLKLQEIHRTANFSIYCRGEDSYFVSTGDHFLIVPLTATGEVIFTRQASPAFDDDVWMLPYGTCHQPFITNNTVKNKLLCSVGWQAEKLTMLTMLRPWATSLRMRMFIYLAQNLVCSNRHQAHQSAVSHFPLHQFETLTESGQLLDSNVIAALYLARHYLSQYPLRRNLPEVQIQGPEND
ncbi:MAG: hypothetical protein CL610_03460 [Anaerolineaceae bacterium]|nr:hypothetical protein [Anaerolineaceae bacterium]